MNIYKTKLSIFIIFISFFNSEVKALDGIESDTTDNPGLTISGSLDTYFRYNLDESFDVAPQTSFANLPGFSLGMANIIAEQSFKNVGFTADFVFGPRGEDATFLSPLLRPGGNSSIVNQLFVSWTQSDALTFTIGNFNTFLGYEVISPTGNFNYSTSYLFSYGPFSHTGIKADYDFGNGFSLMLGIFNPTDATEFNPSNDYAGGVQIAYATDKIGLYLNSLISSDFYQFDLTANFSLTEQLYVGFNASSAKESFYGFAGYLQYAISENFSLGTRAEYFVDNGLGLFTIEESVLDLSLSANITIDRITLIPELRIDMYSENILVTDGVESDNLSSFLLAAVYAF